MPWRTILFPFFADIAGTVLNPSVRQDVLSVRTPFLLRTPWLIVPDTCADHVENTRRPITGPGRRMPTNPH